MNKQTLTSEERHKQMTTAPLKRLVIKMALPTVLSQIITVIYNTADGYFVSHIREAANSAAGAVGVAFSLMSIIQALGFGLGMGANTLISKAFGRKDDEIAHVYGSSAFFAALLTGLLITVFGLAFLAPIMRIMGASDTVLPYACDYSFIILLGAPVMCGSFVLNNVLRSQGEATLAMLGLCAGGLLNAVLDPIFIFTLNMGIRGAALATIIGQSVSFLILLSFFVFKRSIVILSLKKISFKPKIYLDIAKSGLPTVCRQGLASLSTALLNNVARTVDQTYGYNDAMVAAITDANKLYLFVRNVVVGIGQGFQPIGGYNYGAGKNTRVKQAFWFTTRLATYFCVAASLIFFIFANNLIAVFHNDELVVSLARPAVYAFSAAIPFMGYTTYVNQLFQVLGFSGKAAFLASCRQGVFFIPLIILLPLISTIFAVQWVTAISDLLTFAISVPFQVIFFKNKLKSETVTA